MKKYTLVTTLILSVILVITACNSNGSDSKNKDTTGIEGRIIEIVDGEYIIIRNEADTSIYYKIDTSGGLVVSMDVNEELNPDNVIAADVNIINPDKIPQEVKLVSITANKVPDYRVIDAAKAKEMIDAGGVLVVDVRTRTEFESGYIPDAYNVPLDQIENGFKNVTQNKDDVILVYCRSGNRSKVAARQLTEMGYTNVYDFGGIISWPYDIVAH